MFLKQSVISSSLQILQGWILKMDKAVHLKEMMQYQMKVTSVIDLASKAEDGVSAQN